jgi:galactokinase
MEAMNPELRAAARYRELTGQEPAAVASAPGRVNLIGEHVDYHGGHVLPVAIAERTAVAVGPGVGLRACSEQETAVTAPWPPAHRGDWTDYAAGVAAVMGPRDGPWRDGLAVAVASDVPCGAGVSSSAALEVAVALALTRWAGRPVRGGELADIAFRAETGFVGMPCGRMDQMASALTPAGSALLIDCRALTTQAVPVALDLVLADSGERHALRDSEYPTRRREGDEAMRLLAGMHPGLMAMVDLPPARLPDLARSLPEPLGRRVRHVVNENQRTLLAARALESGDTASVGTLINASHNSLRDLYGCSTPRLDAIVESARGLARVVGARLVGAGWGGSVLVACEPGAGGSVAARLRGDAALALPAVREIRLGAGAAPD